MFRPKPSCAPSASSSATALVPRPPAGPPPFAMQSTHVPIPVAIVVSGTKVPCWEQWLDAVISEGFVHIDVRDFMPKDKSVSVKQGENGTSENTQRAIFSQESFAGLMEHLLTHALGTNKLSVFCNAGTHRSDVAGRLLCSVLNSLETPDGDRQFNAQFFTLTNVPQSGLAKMVEDICEWSVSPWVLMDKPAAWYGHEVAKTNKIATKNFQFIADWVRAFKDQNVPGAEVAAGGGEVADDEGDEAARDTTIDDGNADAGGSADASVYPRDDEAAAEEPGADADQREGDADDWEPRRKRSRHGEHDDAGADDSYHHRGGSWGAHEWHGGGGESRADEWKSSDREYGPDDWVSFHGDARRWNDYLIENGVDDGARRELFLLAQLHREGWYAANSILAKIAKKNSDGVTISNASAFVHKSVQNARGKVYGGWA